MEKPGNRFAAEKMSENTTEKERILRKGPASFWQFSVFACAKQPSGFSVSGKSTPNG